MDGSRRGGARDLALAGESRGDDRGAEGAVVSQRVEALAHLAGGIAHDLNNLLAIMLGQSEGLARDPGLSDRARLGAETLADAARRASTLVSRLLSLSRRPVVEATRLDVNATVADVCNLVGRVIDTNIVVELDLAPVPEARGDATILEQCMMNLLLNARGAMALGGIIRVATRTAVEARGFDGATIGGRCVLVTVSDTGEGMAPETRARIFEPLFSTKPAGAGTGLGLSSVHRWLSATGGVIDVASELGRGTTFTLGLPAAG